MTTSHRWPRVIMSSHQWAAAQNSAGTTVTVADRDSQADHDIRAAAPLQPTVRLGRHTVPQPASERPGRSRHDRRQPVPVIPSGNCKIIAARGRQSRYPIDLGLRPRAGPARHPAWPRASSAGVIITIMPQPVTCESRAGEPWARRGFMALAQPAWLTGSPAKSRVRVCLAGGGPPPGRAGDPRPRAGPSCFRESGCPARAGAPLMPLRRATVTGNPGPTLPMLTFAAKMLSTGANGQKADAASPLVRNFDRAVRTARSPFAARAPADGWVKK